MSCQLLLMRHAKSAWDTDAPSDYDRPLAKRGRRDAPRMGSWLRHQGLLPDAVISSPARRAKQTAVRVCRELGVAKDAIIWDSRIYSAEVADLVAVLNDCPDKAEVVLLVGHNPGLEEMLCHLCGAGVASSASDKLLPTAALARLELEGGWKRLKAGAARLVGVMRPRELTSRHPEG